MYFRPERLYSCVHTTRNIGYGAYSTLGEAPSPFGPCFGGCSDTRIICYAAHRTVTTLFAIAREPRKPPFTPLMRRRRYIPNDHEFVNIHETRRALRRCAFRILQKYPHFADRLLCGLSAYMHIFKYEIRVVYHLPAESYRFPGFFMPARGEPLF